MFDLLLPPCSPSTLASGPTTAEDGAKPAGAADAFAALLGALGEAATPKTAPAATAPVEALPRDGKSLPDDIEREPEDAAVVPDAPMKAEALLALLTLPAAIVAAPIPTPLPSAVAVAVEDPKTSGKSADTRSTPIALAPPPLTLTDTGPVQVGAEQIVAKNSTQPGEGQRQPDAAPHAIKLAITLPAQAALRAVLKHEGQPATARVLPEQAAPRAIATLAARGNPERTAQAAIPAAVASTEAPNPALAARRPASIASLPEPGAAMPVATSSEPLPAPDAPASAPAAAPALARHDFAAMIDRLVEARNLAGANPVAMTVRHDDFGAVSLRFRSGDDGLSVTLASPDPDFARAVSAASAAGAAPGQSETLRQGGDASPQRHAAADTARDDSARHSRPAPQDGEPRERRRGDTPRQDREPARPRGGIFA